MSRFEFALAEPGDDAALRELMAATPSGGAVMVSFRREPSYFDATVVEGGFRQIIVARDREHGCIAALGNRSVRQRFVNGVPAAIGFLSNLRILPQYRNQSILARGYRYLHCLHRESFSPMYLTTIAEGNTVARAALVSGRARLPKYRYAGDYHSAVIPLGAKSNVGKSAAEVRAASAQDLPRLIEFLHIAGRRRQFFPVYVADDFFNPAGTFRNLSASDILLAFRGPELVGTLACWNQISFRQTVVEGYSTAVSWARPLVNSWAQLRGGVTLPKAGEPFRFISAALPLVQDDDPEVFESLLQAACSQRTDPQADYLLVGLHERDPLRSLVEKYQTTVYKVGLYYVCWEDGEAFRSQIDDRPPYLELGCL